jgi:16S rRNA (adenine1518-N6/adenine1519-N6)-dimethyltransferase
MEHAPRKRFGQHFLQSPGIVAKIVAAIDPRPDDAMVEIGPGLAALTAPLLERVRHLHVIEIDRDIAARLRDGYPPERLTVHEGDVLKFDFAKLPPELRVVGNLPYNISTPILFHLLDYRERVRDMHFMLQREVVDRMAAAPSTPDYGRLSVMLQARFAITKLIDVPPGAFRPPPKVDSAVVRLVPLAPALDCDAATFGRVVTAAFTKRRKTLRNALAGVVQEESLAALGIDPQLRPENLAVQDYVRLARVALPDRAEGS